MEAPPAPKKSKVSIEDLKSAAEHAKKKHKADPTTASKAAKKESKTALRAAVEAAAEKAAMMEDEAGAGETVLTHKHTHDT
jgi:hypothetical protein